MKNGILICLVISIIIGLYELYWFLYKGSELGLVLAVLSFVISYLSFSFSINLYVKYLEPQLQF